MKISNPTFFASILILAATPLAAQNYAGWVDSGNCNTVSGWAWDATQPNTPISVDLYDLVTPVATVYANAYRSDLYALGYGNGYHGFSFTVPPYLKDGHQHYFYAYAAGTKVGLSGTTAINCPAGTTGYVYYYNDPLTSIDLSKWTQNGSVSATSSGLTATSTNGGSLISSVAVPDGTNDYEVKTTLAIPANGGTYVSYLRASSNAQTGPGATGTFYSLEATPAVSSGGCWLTLTFNKTISGSVTQVLSFGVPCHNGIAIHAAIRGAIVTVSTDNQEWWAFTDTSITTGKPGVGALGTAAGNSISAVSIGPADRTAPQAPDPSTFSTSVLPNRMDFKFSGVPDDPNGLGIGYYVLLRNDGWVSGSHVPEFSDETVAPSTSYTYSVYAVDFHYNLSATKTFTVTTPPSGSVDPRRIGLRPTGTYWGGSGEQIDVLSGNLNFTLPLLRAQGRGGWGVPFALNYNSQNWRQDSGGTWNLGTDVGYGYGWKLLAGSLTPYYTNWWALDHYVFTDSTGAEYRLGQNNNGLWYSSETLYVGYDSNTNILHFRDGSYWIMGCTSSGSEPDAGTLYPTTMEDTNGNQVMVYYFPGAALPFTNTSARIQYIQDVRAVNGGYLPRSYTFIYTTDVVPHLTSIQNWIGTSEGYQFTFAATQPLTSPFSSTTFGGLNALSSVKVLGVNLLYNLTANSSGEMTQVTFPYGGYLKWAYGNVSYSSGFTQREIQTRTMSKDGTVGAEKAYPFTHESPTNTHPTHQFTLLADPGGIGQKRWTFSPSGSNIGLVTQYQGQQISGPTTLVQNDFTWTQDATGNFYIGSTLNTFNPGPAISKTNQTVDVYGNVTQVQKFNFGNLTTPARTYNYTYLNSSNYASRYIYNRLTLATVTDGTNNATLASNVYDYYALTSVTGSPQEWDASYASVIYRGNLSTSTTPDGLRNLYYDQTGNPSTIYVNGIGVQLTQASANNFAAPTQLTTGSLTNTLTWSSFLGLTNDTGPNGDSSSTTYDSYARPSQTTSPFGAVTNYTYNTGPYSSSNPATVTATIQTNNRWTKTTLDGFGRTIKTETGDASSTKSVAESVYGPCACSPLGKLVQQAMPHAVGATPTWTTYTYDGIGRTLSAATVGTDTQGTTTYSYAYASYGLYITVTDPAGKYKYYLTDALNNLIAVSEPPTSSEPNGAATYYYYDLLDHLSTVGMVRSTGAQTRTFVYSGNNLISATNPENGTVTYTYNSYNKVATKTDAKGQQIQYTYDTLGRLKEIHRFPLQNGQLYEDTCQKELYSYDTNPYDSSYSGIYTAGRLTAVQYYSQPYNAGNGSCYNTFTEMYSYNAAGARLGKRLRVARYLVANTVDLNSSYTYDTEGRMTAAQYPGYTQYGSPVTGPNLGYAFDSMGRLNTMTDLATQASIVTGATYGAANQLLSISGQFNETRTYNSMLQLTSLVAGSTVNVSYNYPATQNNGKIGSQTDHISGEQVVYTYDNLNRLASATATNNSWGQSYSYDGFGNLTAQTVTAGSAPSYSATPDPTTNHLGGEDANGNAPVGGVWGYDVENRYTGNYDYSGNRFSYSYAPGNKRVWRGVWVYGTSTVDEVTFWAVSGQKLATYQLSVNGAQVVATQTGTNYYFGGKLIKNANGYVAADRLGSIGKFYPYGQEKPSATQNGSEKFTGYIRDAESGLDYADQRYHNPGTGRFLTPDAYMASGGPSDPGSWNRYAYTRGDPTNRVDPSGRFDCDPSDVTCSTNNFCNWYPEDCWANQPGPEPEPPIGDAPAEDFLGRDETDARNDLSKVKCYSLFGFASAQAAQSAFDGVRFNYASYGKLDVAGGTPASQPAPANTLGYGTININTDYNWGDFSKVTTKQGGIYDYLAFLNAAYKRSNPAYTNLNSEQLGTLIILHELGHQQTNPKQPSDAENAAEKIAIALNCIH